MRATAPPHLGISLGLLREVFKNKTKYFCSDSMMKYALREGLERAERAKKEMRESADRTKRELKKES